MAYDLDPLPRTDTPSDYTRFKFDPANVGDKRIVGLLACQRDPLLRSLKTKVHSVREASIKTAPPPKGKGNKKKGGDSVDSRNAEIPIEDKGKLYEIELLDTVIFPEGGGQPSDTGYLNTFDSNGGIQDSFRVESCLRKKLDGVHLVRIPPGKQFDLKEGDEVEVVVDWDRRLDHMALHTSQHLLSALLDTMGLPTLSWSMHPFPSLESPYVELPRSLSQEEAEQVEKKCNDLIAESRKVWVDITIQGEDQESETQENRDVGQVEERVKAGKGIPEDYDGGVIRHINIDQIDRNACCGTQVPFLGLLNLMHILPPTTISNSQTKLFFVAGPRAIRYLQYSSRQLSQIAKITGSGRQDVVDKVETIEKNRKDFNDGVKELRNELSKLIIEKTTNQLEKEKNKGIVIINREQEKSTHDFEFLSGISNTIIQNNPSTAQIENEKPLLILTSTYDSTPRLQSKFPDQQITTSTSLCQTLLLIQSSDNDLAKEINENVKEEFGNRIKGGGAKGKYMSKVEGKWGKKENKILQDLVHTLRERRTNQ
ncbi:uncharacterized protein L201_005074 [Kwoniella dendrophila CBS 6074]|uniref:Alanyl-transfer RNA synthetases family profile domain-containing protein n=1 Tax=Kwoniella dendrophila CBS 6074 TaxID=1295534 RepID=A0AAX4JY56_9TREE